ncbi:MAG: hypothetical protein H7A21_13260 [Spirochaetales bacterium]|nr:antitoxin [Leptospiraceae bacterium]MCP5482397.1 hypothetical protein [Spirochaetales bacterium]MCP5484164.1 hypothetical protein [Spirochaetales bacterium]
MKNVTLSADERLIRQARERARREKKTLNAVFREWLARYVDQEPAAKGYSELMESLRYAQPGRRFSREEMNAR